MRIDPSDIPSNTRFGLVFTMIFFGLAAFWIFTGWMPAAFGALGFGLVLAELTRFFPAALSKPNLAWALLGLALGTVVGTIVLGLIFFTVITPMALFFRVIGRDELRLRRGTHPSYWRPREDDLATSKFSDQF